MERKTLYLVLAISTAMLVTRSAYAQQTIARKDSIVYNIIYRDTVIYRHDTVTIRHYTFADTLQNSVSPIETGSKRKRLINPNSWGIGPSLGAYYSPFNGFDLNIGFGVQYYFLAIPSFRNPHMRHAKTRHK